MSNLENFLNLFTGWVIELTVQHGIVIVMLAVLGAFAILSAIGSKVFQAIKYLFLIFVAIPAIIIVGLISKSSRKERLKELGEIRAFVKEKPERWKRAMYYLLFCLFVLVIVIILYWIFQTFLSPFYQLNEFSKIALQNYSANYTNVT